MDLGVAVCGGDQWWCCMEVVVASGGSYGNGLCFWLNIVAGNGAW